MDEIFAERGLTLDEEAVQSEYDLRVKQMEVGRGRGRGRGGGGAGERGGPRGRCGKGLRNGFWSSHLPHNAVRAVGAIDVWVSVRSNIEGRRSPAQSSRRAPPRSLCVHPQAVEQPFDRQELLDDVRETVKSVTVIEWLKDNIKREVLPYDHAGSQGAKEAVAA